MWQNWLLAIVTALLPLGVVFAWKANRVMNRMWDVLEEYPPHLHVGKNILYPKGMKPEDPQELDRSNAARA